MITQNEFKELQEKRLFINNLFKAVNGINNFTGVVKLYLDVFEDKNESLQEFIVVKYNMAKKVRCCNWNSNLANLQEATKLLATGYYDEIKYYEEIKEGSTPFENINIKYNITPGVPTGESERLAFYDLHFFENYNQEFYNGKYRGSEANPYKLTAISEFIKIRDSLTYIEDYVEGRWERLDIQTSHSKYGTNYIFIEPYQKLWRIRETANEFYGSGGDWPEYQRKEDK